MVRQRVSNAKRGEDKRGEGERERRKREDSVWSLLLGIKESAKIESLWL